MDCTRRQLWFSGLLRSGRLVYFSCMAWFFKCELLSFFLPSIIFSLPNKWFMWKSTQSILKRIMQMELLHIKATSPSSSIHPTSCNEVMRVVASEFFCCHYNIFYSRTHHSSAHSFKISIRFVIISSYHYHHHIMIFSIISSDGFVAVYKIVRVSESWKCALLNNIFYIEIECIIIWVCTL